jgi:hypothetical protein
MTTAVEGGEGVSVTPRPLFTPRGKHRVPTVQEAGWAQGRSGQVRKISNPTGIRYPDRSARNQSLYRLHYPYRNIKITTKTMYKYFQPGAVIISNTITSCTAGDKTADLPCALLCPTYDQHTNQHTSCQECRSASNNFWNLNYFSMPTNSGAHLSICTYLAEEIAYPRASTLR